MPRAQAGGVRVRVSGRSSWTSFMLASQWLKPVAQVLPHRVLKGQQGRRHGAEALNVKVSCS